MLGQRCVYKWIYTHVEGMENVSRGPYKNV